MRCPICDSPNAKIEKSKRSFFGSLFGTKAPSPRVLCSCPNCHQVWTVDERDGTIWEADKEQVKKAREEWARRGFVGPDIVCNGYPEGKGAEVWGFNEKAKLWLKANVNSGRWILQGQALQVPIEEVSQIVKKASAAGLQVKTNNLGAA
jgi:hypothetical protein